MKIDLTWGESVAVREQFIRQVDPFNLIAKNRSDLANLNYSPFEGDPELLVNTKILIERQYGKKYRHIILTNGAAGGCVIAMRAYQKQGFKSVITYKAPYFSLYPGMIQAAGLTQVHIYPELAIRPIALVDSPSNPLGIVREAQTGMFEFPIIWDAVYANNVYMKTNVNIPHDVLVGSYSKLTGLNGVRIGWIATDDTWIFERIKDLVTSEYCGLSVPSMQLLNECLERFDWATFERNARFALDTNREEWAKLEKYFQGEPVSENGMFFYGPMDNKCKELFEKANVLWTPGSKLGDDDAFGRFNIGQSLSNIKNAVAQVIKIDTIR